MIDSFYYKNRFLIPSTRLKHWDYSSVGFYFVTTCTYQKRCYFGEIIKGEMKLNRLGKIVYEEWLKTKEIRKNVDLDEFIIMPNHLHGILIIKYKINVETHCNASLQKNVFNKFGPQRNNLASIIRGFKSKTTNRIHQLGFYNFRWQPRFYDHIIRNEKSLDEIRQYIKNNPLKWEEDEENPKNQKSPL
jgi:REP element-mobilizing transposase RayT